MDRWEAAKILGTIIGGALGFYFLIRGLFQKQKIEPKLDEYKKVEQRKLESDGEITDKKFSLIQSKSNKTSLILILIIFCILIVGILFFYRMKDNVNETDILTTNEIIVGNNVYKNKRSIKLNGKISIVDEADKRIDRLHWLIPENRRGEILYGFPTNIGSSFEKEITKTDYIIYVNWIKTKEEEAINWRNNRKILRSEYFVRLSFVNYRNKENLGYQAFIFKEPRLIRDLDEWEDRASQARKRFEKKIIEYITSENTLIFYK